MSNVSSNSEILKTATTSIIPSFSSIAGSFLISFAFFYIINFALMFIYLKFVAKSKISWPALIGIVGGSAAMAFLAFFLAIVMNLSNPILVFLLIFVIIAILDLALIKYLLKLKKGHDVILSLILAILANPILWLSIL